MPSLHDSLGKADQLDMCGWTPDDDIGLFLFVTMNTTYMEPTMVYTLIQNIRSAPPTKIQNKEKA